MLPTAGIGRLGLRSGAVNLKASSVAPAHVTSKSAEIMEQAKVTFNLLLAFVLRLVSKFCFFIYYFCYVRGCV